MSSMEEKNSKNYTEALDWVGPKEKILPGLKSILDKLKLEKTLEKEDSIQVFMKSGLNSNIKFQFHFNDQDKKIDLKAFSNDSSAKKDEITKHLEEIKFKYFQREF